MDGSRCAGTARAAISSCAGTAARAAVASGIDGCVVGIWIAVTLTVIVGVASGAVPAAASDVGAGGQI